MVELNIGETKLLWPTTAAAILAFYGQRMDNEDSTFTADQLRFYVNNNTVGKVSPSSSDRVLRMLRQNGKLDYIVENRGRSLYRAVEIGTTIPPDKVFGA